MSFYLPSPVAPYARTRISGDAFSVCALADPWGIWIRTSMNMTENKAFILMEVARKGVLESNMATIYGGNS